MTPTLLPARLLNLVRHAHAHQPVVRLALLHHLVAVVDEREPRALAAAVLRPEAEARDLVLVAFVELRELVAQLVFGYVRALGVEHVAVKYCVSGSCV